jgi:hypothetical protein
MVPEIWAPQTICFHIDNHQFWMSLGYPSWSNMVKHPTPWAIWQRLQEAAATWASKPCQKLLFQKGDGLVEKMYQKSAHLWLKTILMLIMRSDSMICSCCHSCSMLFILKSAERHWESHMSHLSACHVLFGLVSPRIWEVRRGQGDSDSDFPH